MSSVERALRAQVLRAARKYADDSRGGSEHGALESGSLLRIAAKRWREAELAEASPAPMPTIVRSVA